MSMIGLSLHETLETSAPRRNTDVAKLLLSFAKDGKNSDNAIVM